MASTGVLDRLEAAFSKSRAALLTSDAGRWARFVQPADRCRRPQFVGCFDIETEACNGDSPTLKLVYLAWPSDLLAMSAVPPSLNVRVAGEYDLAFPRGFWDIDRGAGSDGS